MVSAAKWRAIWRIRRRQVLALTASLLILMVLPGTRSRLFRAREETGSAAFPSSMMVARLDAIPRGAKLRQDGPPAGWSHIVIKPVPKLESGDLDTLSPQAFDVAQRIRPLILADVERVESEGESTFRLARVGVGLCAPGHDGVGDVVVTPRSVEGTRGAWTTKERILLAAMSFEARHARLVAATPTFALLRTPNVFLVSGKHRKLDACYALLVDPQTGVLRSLVWRDGVDTSKSKRSFGEARRIDQPLFDLPMDVHATRLPGSIPVAWSFAIRVLPPGINLPLPQEVTSSLSLKADEADPQESAQIEQAFVRVLKTHK